MPAEHHAHGADRGAEQNGATEGEGPYLRRRKRGRRDRPEGLTRFTRHEGAIPLAGAAWVPPGLEGLVAGELLHEIRSRPAPVLLEEEVAGQPWAKQEGADEKHHHRRRHEHLGARQGELAQQREYGRGKQEEGNPIGDAPDNVGRVVDGKRELGCGGIEEQPGDLQVPEGKSGEQDTHQDAHGDGRQQPVTRHGKAPEFHPLPIVHDSLVCIL